MADNVSLSEDKNWRRVFQERVYDMGLRSTIDRLSAARCLAGFQRFSEGTSIKVFLTANNRVRIILDSRLITCFFEGSRFGPSQLFCCVMGKNASHREADIFAEELCNALADKFKDAWIRVKMGSLDPSDRSAPWNMLGPTIEFTEIREYGEVRYT